MTLINLIISVHYRRSCPPHRSQLPSRGSKSLDPPQSSFPALPSASKTPCSAFPKEKKLIYPHKPWNPRVLCPWHAGRCQGWGCVRVWIVPGLGLLYQGWGCCARIGAFVSELGLLFQVWGCCAGGWGCFFRGWSCCFIVGVVEPLVGVVSGFGLCQDQGYCVRFRVVVPGLGLLCQNWGCFRV